MSDWYVDPEPNPSAFERLTWRFLPLLLFGLVGVALWMGADSLASERPQAQTPAARTEAPAGEPLCIQAPPLPLVDQPPSECVVD